MCVGVTHRDKHIDDCSEKEAHIQSLTQSEERGTHIHPDAMETDTWHTRARTQAYPPGTAQCHGPAPSACSSGHIQAQTPSGLPCCLPDEEGSAGPFALKSPLSVQGSSRLRLSSPYMSCSSPRSQGEGQGLESPQRATPSLRGSQIPQSSTWILKDS